MNTIYERRALIFRSALNYLGSYSIVIFSIFLIIRVLFLFTDFNSEMMEQLLYSFLFELLSINFLVAKYSENSDGSDVLIKTLSSVTVLFSLATIYFIFHLPPEEVHPHFTSLGSFSFQSLMGFTLLALSLFFQSSKILASQILALITLFIGIESLTIHLFEVDLGQSFFKFSGLGPTSSLFFIVLSCGCLSLTSDQKLIGLIFKRSGHGRVPRQMLFFSIFIPFLLAWLRIHLEGKDDLNHSAMVTYLAVFTLCLFITSYLWFTHLLLEEAHSKNQLLHEKLAQSETGLKRALESSHQGAWEFDFLLNRIIFDQTCMGILKSSDADTFINFPHFLQLLDHQGRLDLSNALHSDHELNINLDLALISGNQKKWISLRGQKTHDTHHLYLKAYGTIQDITKEKEAIEALKVSEEKLRLALEAGGMGTFEWSTKDGIIKLSPKSQEIYNLDRHPGEHTYAIQEIHDLIEKEDLFSTKEAYQISINGHHAIHQYEYKLKTSADCLKKWIGYRGKTTFDDVTHEPQTMMGVIFDETRLKSSMQELRQEKELREKFIATLSHDLRNVLSVCLGYLELSRRHSDRPDHIISFSLKSEAAIRRGMSMIKDLLDLSFFQQSGSFPLKEFTTFRIMELMEDARDSFPEISHRLISSWSENFSVSWSQGDMKRVLENLIGNAIKYGSKDAEITLRAIKEKDRAIIEVQNTGVAMDESALKGLFSYLERPGHSSWIEGWGLGLSIVKGIVEAHQGRVSVVSDEEHTTFTLNLPLQK